MLEAGLVSVTFRELSPEEIICLMKENGLKYIEWGSDVHARPDDISALRSIKKLQEENGIICCSYGSYFRLGVNRLSELKNYIKAAEILGTGIIRVWCGDKGYTDYNENEKRTLLNLCKKAAKEAQACRVTLCCECHIKTFTDSVAGAVRLMGDTGCESFRMYWQPNQYKSETENLQYAERISEYTTHIHCFNWKEKSKFPLNEAEDIWKRYLNCFSGDHKVLLEFMPDNKPESLKPEVKALKKIIGESK